jgi:hypothetical protein
VVWVLEPTDLSSLRMIITVGLLCHARVDENKRFYLVKA